MRPGIRFGCSLRTSHTKSRFIEDTESDECIPTLIASPSSFSKTIMYIHLRELDVLRDPQDVAPCRKTFPSRTSGIRALNLEMPEVA